MTQISVGSRSTSEKLVHTLNARCAGDVAPKNIRFVLDGLRGEVSIAEFCGARVFLKASSIDVPMSSLSQAKSDFRPPCLANAHSG